MKKVTLAIVAIAMMLNGLFASAQGKFGADSVECLKYLDYYTNYFKQKSYDDALTNWRNAYKYCPPASRQSMLVDGTTLMRRLISQNAKDPEYKQALIDTLMTLHQQRIEYFPKYAVSTLNNKGVDLSNFVKDPKVLYPAYNEIIEANQENTKASILLWNLNTAIELFKAGDLEAEEVINTYQRNIALINEAPAKTEAEIAANAKAKSDMEGLFIGSKVASCENLIALFTPRFEANPEDKVLVSNIVKMLNNAEDCTNNDLFLNAVTALHKIDPSYTSAYYLYRLNSSRGNIDEAINYLEQAIESPESDTATDGEYYYELAAVCLKNKMTGKAFTSANKAADMNPAMKGKAYFLIGTIWGSTSCGGDEISRRAPYWVAVDYLQKAKAADASLTDDANALISQYSRYYPQAAEAFMYDLTDGKAYTVSCGGMTATTTVRTQK